MRILPALVLALCAVPPLLAATPLQPPGPWLDSSMGLLQAELTARFGPEQKLRIQRGLAQTARFWRSGDGGADVFENFVREEFVPAGPALDALSGRMEAIALSLDGHLREARQDLKRDAELDLGPPLAVDGLLAGFDPGAHLGEDGFGSKLAFAVLLNFPFTTVEERVRDGGAWTARQWAEAWLAERFARRVPGGPEQAVAEAGAAAQGYLAGCALRMDHVVDGRGRPLFPPGLRLLPHWNLREEIRAQYREGKAGLPRQRALQRILERIAAGTVPAVVLDNPGVDWNPSSNAVTPPGDPAPDDQRYRMLARVFRAEREVDAWCPAAPTRVFRSFQEGRQLPEARVRRMLETMCGSPLAPRVAALIRRRLGRALEPFDIWYDGFRAASPPEAELDARARQRYPAAAAYARDLPRLLRQLGFDPETADRVASRIDVALARDAGGAAGPLLPGGRARLSTRIGPDGMDFKGFSIAVHQTGHCVQRLLALDGAEHPLAAGVPGRAFAEALAFTFQARDQELLGLPGPAPGQRALEPLDAFWTAWELSGVALVDLAVWHWMYEHLDAGPGDLAGAVWNRYYAPVLGQKDCALLACYSHLVSGRLDLPDYPLGRMIAFQLQAQAGRAGGLGGEFRRWARLGRLTPDLWLQRATGGVLGPGPLLEAAEAALSAGAKAP